MKNIIISPHPHPRCGNTNPAYGIVYVYTHFFILFYVYSKSVKSFLAGVRQIEKHIVWWFPWFYKKKTNKRSNNISATGPFLEQKIYEKFIFS